MQATHFKLVYNVAKKLGLWDPKKVRMDHVQFGLVLGSDKKKFKTRSGETIKLSELLEEGKSFSFIQNYHLVTKTGFR